MRLSPLVCVLAAACGNPYGHGAYKPSVAYEAAGPTPSPATERPGLGTSFGESVYAPIHFTPFQRAAAAPWAQVVLHYNDADGVDAHAAYLGGAPEPL